jgi:hypothetical protein
MSSDEREQRAKTAGPPMTFDQEMALETQKLLQEIKDQSAPSTQVGPAAAPQGQSQTAADDKGNVWDLKGGQWVLRPR